MASTVRKLREINEDTQLLLFFSLVPHPKGWFHPLVGRMFPAQLNLSGIPLTDIAKGVCGLHMLGPRCGTTRRSGPVGIGMTLE